MEEIKKFKNYEILTPTGFKSFDGIRKLKKESYIELTDHNLKCSPNHRLYIDGHWIEAKELKHTVINSEIILYDPLAVEDHAYLSNNIVSHNCDFIGSTNTLIHSNKLKSLTYKHPLYKDGNGLKVYEEPCSNHTYVMVVDTARGSGLDYNAFVVVDITKVPYRVVATFRNNEMSPVVYPNVILPVARKFADAFILVEINDIGAQVAEILYNEMEYENVLMASVRGRKGQTLDGGFGGADIQLGLRTTRAVKRLGCSLLKSFIEDDKLLFWDYDILQELVSFVSKNQSFEAETNHTDDLVMCLVLFGWLTTQGYFKDMVNMDIRKQIFDERLKEIEEELTPFGFIEAGYDSEVEIDDQGTGWYLADPKY